MRTKRPPHDPLPDGETIEITHRKGHFLSPSEMLVNRYLADPTEEMWSWYEQEYLELLQESFEKHRKQFDQLAEQACSTDVHLGCYCPTKKNPNVYHCHTVLALWFFEERYRALTVVFPDKFTKPS